MTELPILFFDGTCGLCHRAVGFLLRHDARASLRFAPLQGPTAAAKLNPRSELPDTLVLVDHGHVYVRSEAALRSVTLLGGAWRLAGVLRLVPRVLRDRVYDWTARHRFAWFGYSEACASLDESARHRFLP